MGNETLIFKVKRALTVVFLGMAVSSLSLPPSLSAPAHLKMGNIF